MWPFKRNSANLQSNETRSASGTGYTGLIMAARESYISGASGIGELTGTVSACVSLWEGAFALADVEGTDLLTRHAMGLLARSVTLRGEAVFLIRGDRLLPCADWDLSTRDGIPRAYRVSISEAGGNRSETALAAEILHFTIAADPVAPWTGQAPLRRAQLSAQLLQEVETALMQVYRDAPLGTQVLPLPDSSADDMEQMRGAFRGRRGSTLIVEGAAQATAAGMNPQLGQRAQDLSPDLSKSMTGPTLAAARDSICMAFGVLPALFNSNTTGPMCRESQRHLAGWVLQPMAETFAEEATRKLGSKVIIDVGRPLQRFDAGGRARALSQVIEAMGRAKELDLTPEQIEAAFKSVNWGGGDALA
jgi:phage portal protein BeeE